jgi:hypothetical protein
VAPTRAIYRGAEGLSAMKNRRAVNPAGRSARPRRSNWREDPPRRCGASSPAHAILGVGFLPRAHRDAADPHPRVSLDVINVGKLGLDREGSWPIALSSWKGQRVRAASVATAGHQDGRRHHRAAQPGPRLNCRDGRPLTLGRVNLLCCRGSRFRRRPHPNTGATDRRIRRPYRRQPLP